METIKSIILLSALICATTIWAQNPITVATENELRTAVQTDNAQILFGDNISITSLLEIQDSKTITIDMNGFTLDRGCTSRGSQVIVVRTGSTLNLSNGTLTGGWGGNGGAIDIETGTTVNLTDVIISGNHADDRGGGISNQGTLTMTGGSITGNTTNDKTAPEGGGGIFNYYNSSATLTGVTISGNVALEKGGGGVCNYGTITLNDCIITSNRAQLNGGGIWDGRIEGKDVNVLIINGCTITGNRAEGKGGGIYGSNVYGDPGHEGLRMTGVVTVKGNTGFGGLADNLFLDYRKYVYVIGDLTGSNIGVTLERPPHEFTKDFKTQNPNADINSIFHPDMSDIMTITLSSNNEGYMIKNIPDNVIYYVERAWDDERKEVTATFKYLTERIDNNATPTSETQYKLLTTTGDALMRIGTENSEIHEFYVVDDQVEVFAVSVEGPNVHIILCDQDQLTLGDEIAVTEGHTLYIHNQATEVNMGKIRRTGDDDIGCIGGYDSDGYKTLNGGNIEIHGGDLDLFCNAGGAPIGGRYNRTGDIKIYGGKIRAEAKHGAAGIGGGLDSKYYGNICIYGGTIHAIGSDNMPDVVGNGGAGIGGSEGCEGGDLHIYGGTITATTNGETAGIGCGQSGGDKAAGTIIIDGGIVKAYGGNYAAGIGGGDSKNGADLIVNGGHVEAYGGTDAAGIGGGEGGNGGTVTINGGYVYAQGKSNGAGIGGGEDGKGANVTINGGIVIAKAGKDETGCRAIGPGKGNDDYGQLTIGDAMMVSSERLATAVERKNMCWYRAEARIEPCTHNNATYTDNGSSVSVGCIYCLTGAMPYTFYYNGNWNDENKWFCGFMPHDGNDVAVKADATIPSGCCAHVGDITIDGGSITIADGGQLIHNNAGVKATMQKAITGHGGDNENGWNFIASPMVTNITPSANNGFLTEDYDLYYYDEPTHYWMNHKGSEHGDFDIEPQKGYLYASQANTTLNMTGTLQPSNNPVTISGLSHEASVLNGFNLVGNPFACNATIDRPFYVIEGKHVVAYEGNEPIAPATGVMVQADAEHESVTFTKVTPEEQAAQPNNGSLQIALMQANTRSNAKIDKAIVSFREGRRLEKFHFGNDAKLYIPQGGKDYAIAFSEGQGEMPLNFKATENGEYTILVNPEGVEMAYLHLIDNLTGADVDLLTPAGFPLCKGGQGDSTPASYTFTAKTTDYTSRFKLVFSVFGDADSDNDAPFAFVSNGEIIVFADTGTASLQVIDVMGRVVRAVGLSQCGSRTTTTGMAPGVYVLRLINSDKVTTQKIIIE